MSRPAYLAGLIVALIAGLALRGPRLGERPMHCDEAVHAIKFNTLWQTGRYVYDPREYHGPTLYYAALPIVWLSGEHTFARLSEATLRLVPLLFGVGLILLLPLVADGLGRTATVWAALLTAVSPAFVYYSRYYIQEILLVFFTFALLACGWRYWRSRRIGWALLAGASLGFMHATKETCVIVWGCMALTLLMLWMFVPRAHASSGPRRIRLAHVAAGLAMAAAVSVALFTAFFTNLSGPIDSIRTYATYFDRAGNFGVHNHPWDFYFRRLLWYHEAAGPAWSEALIVGLALIGAVAALVRVRGDSGPPHAVLPAFVALYTILMTVVYTAISYKTPWCALGFLHGMILLAGVGAQVLTCALRRPIQDGDPQATTTSATQGRRYGARALIAGILLAAGVIHLGLEARTTTSRKFAADGRNPYVYAHTVNDLLSLVDWIHRLAETNPARSEMIINVMAQDDDYWPLPWYLRSFHRVGYWNRVPQPLEGDILIVGTSLTKELEPQRGERYPQVNIYGLRPGVQMLTYVSEAAWQAFRRTQPAAPTTKDAPP